MAKLRNRVMVKRNRMVCPFHWDESLDKVSAGVIDDNFPYNPSLEYAQFEDT